jgi:hypothetical protein
MLSIPTLASAHSAGWLLLRGWPWSGGPVFLACDSGLVARSHLIACVLRRTGSYWSLPARPLSALCFPVAGDLCWQRSFCHLAVSPGPRPALLCLVAVPRTSGHLGFLCN